jgi:hypothetical protein
MLLILLDYFLNVFFTLRVKSKIFAGEHHQLSIINNAPSTINHQSTVINHQSSTTLNEHHPLNRQS